MKAWLRDIVDALLLRPAVFRRVADRPDAFMRGLLVIVAVSLLAGLPTLVQGIVRGFEPVVVAEPSELKLDVIDPKLDTIVPWLRMAGLSDASIDQLLTSVHDSALLAGGIASRLQAADTLFPRPLARAFAAVGHWASTPFANSPWPLATAALATWLGYGVWVMLVAKLLGGRGTLHGFFGATAFFAAPHVLAILSLVPVLGGVVGVIAFLWGIVIYIAATAASHEFSVGKAVLAVFLPVISLLAVLALLLFPIGVLALFSVGSR